MLNRRNQLSRTQYPKSLVGVLTAMNISSDSFTAVATSVVKNKFTPLCSKTYSERFGSKMGNLSDFQASILLLSISATMILTLGQCLAITAIVGPPTYPAPIQHIVWLNTPEVEEEAEALFFADPVTRYTSPFSMGSEDELDIALLLPLVVLELRNSLEPSEKGFEWQEKN